MLEMNNEVKAELRTLGLASRRSAGLDLVRCFAIFCVIGGHFFAFNTPFRQVEFAGVSMFIQGAFKMLLGVGVPLFLLLTGYLNCRKEISWKYYRGALRVLGAYLLFSLITVLFRVWYLGQEGSLWYWVQQVLNFSAIPYGWYIEMWIGLFLLAPFLNVLWRHIPGRGQKLLLLATLFVMTALPNFTNRYGVELMPDFWAQCYPLVYYFVGAYLREKENVNNCYSGGVATGLIVALCLINPVVSLLLAPGRPMLHPAGDGNSALGMLLAVAVFLLLYRWDTRCEWLRRGLASVSKASLDMYLCCYMFDALFYPFFMEHYYESQAQFGWWFFVLVPLVFAASYATARLKQVLCRF